MVNLGLGTVQFGLAYGVSNRAGRVSIEEVRSILEVGRSAGMKVLDTAIAYGESEEVLGRLGVTDWNVVTKLGSADKAVGSIGSFVLSQVEGSLERLGVRSLDAVLLHKSADGLGAGGSEVIRALEKAQINGWVRSVGVSIYDPSELDALWSHWRPELVQAPFNVFDRRIERSGWLEKLLNSGCRVHARSVFLQGLLLMSRDETPAWFSRWSSILSAWRSWCSGTGLSQLEAALSYVTSDDRFETAIVGVQSAQQLADILRARDLQALNPRPDFDVADLDLIEPSRWRLK